MTKTKSVVIVDDHPLIREAVRSLLSARSDIEIVGEGDVGEDVVPLMETHEPDILLLDLNMPQKKVANNGSKFHAPAVIKEIRRRWPDTGVIVLTMENVPALILQTINWGVAGYVLKGDDLSLQLITAIDMVSKGSVYFSESVSQTLVGKKEDTQNVTLTPRQMEIMTLVYRNPDGSNLDYAQALGIKEGTVRSHLSSAYVTLGVTNVKAAILRCLELGFFENRTPPPSR
jgi:two-component system, NarL family, response regulator DegU